MRERGVCRAATGACGSRLQLQVQRAMLYNIWNEIWKSFGQQYGVKEYADKQHRCIKPQVVPFAILWQNAALRVTLVFTVKAVPYSEYEGTTGTANALASVALRV